MMKIKTKLKIWLGILMFWIVLVVGQFSVAAQSVDVCESYVKTGDELYDAGGSSGPYAAVSYLEASCCYLRADNPTEAKKYAQKSVDFFEKTPMEQGGGATGVVYFIAKSIATKNEDWLDEAEQHLGRVDYMPRERAEEMINGIREKLFGKSTSVKVSEQPSSDWGIPILALIIGVIIGIVIGVILMKKKK